MNFHILTLFPEIFSTYFNEGVLGKAQEKGLIQIFCHNLRDYTKGKYRSVDDRPYGGGSGMVMMPEVVVPAVRDLRTKHKIEKVILLSPRGIPFVQSLARRFSTLHSILFICGRYEGVDQRIIDLVVDEEISLGDFVLTGGELAAAAVVDAVSRLIPGVLGNEDAVTEESFSEELLEYPHYTRPVIFEGLEVPKILLSGNHQEIAKWRSEEALRVTKKRRPDLLKK